MTVSLKDILGSSGVIGYTGSAGLGTTGYTGSGGIGYTGSKGVEQYDIFTVTDGNANLNTANGFIQTWSLGANRSPTISMNSGEVLQMWIQTNGYSVIWPGTITSWINGGQPLSLANTAGTYNIVNFQKIGSYIFASYNGYAST